MLSEGEWLLIGLGSLVILLDKHFSRILEEKVEGVEMISDFDLVSKSGKDDN